MQKQVMKTVHVCDHCGSEECYGNDGCLGCGVEHCYECKKTEGRVYNHAVSFSGSGDGYYCNVCDAKLTSDGTDKRHNAYREIAALRTEAQIWGEDFQRRQKVAEKALSSLAA